jgi:maltooligosyltrehalose trehalohydrolase
MTRVKIFRVWAPNAQQVKLEIDGRRIPMSEAHGGWWSAAVERVPDNADYAFILDDGKPLPDPRSPWQPGGVQGPSRVVDLRRFSWTDQNWQAGPLGSAVFYELHVGTFTPDGTFEAAIRRLDHLRTLGVTHVELMPVAEFPGSRGWGYDGVDLYAPHHSYGGPEGLMKFVDACHAKGLAVILDVVYNHLGPSGNYLESFGPYFTDRYATPWGKAVNLDGPGSTELRRYFRDNALMWLRDYHFDGLRIDAVHAIVDTSAVHLLEQLAEEVRRLESQLGRHLVLIAESDLNDPRIVRPPEIGGYGIDAQWSDDYHHSLHAVLTGERDGYYADFGSLADLAKALTHGYVYDGKYSAHRQRRHGRPATGLSGHRFLAYLQNHDQIGNRAKGERSSHLMTVGLLKVAAALTFTSAFLPVLFQGEEWGASSPFQYFTDHEDPEFGHKVKEGRRGEFASFGWDPQEIPDPQAEVTFQRSKLNWKELEREPHSSLLRWHRDLIGLRRDEPTLRDGDLAKVKVRYDEDAKWLLMERGTVIVASNFGAGTRRVSLNAECRRILLASDDAIRVHPQALELPPQSVAILRGEPPSSGNV